MDPKKIDEFMCELLKSMQNDLEKKKEAPKEVEEDDTEDEEFEVNSSEEVSGPMNFEQVLGVLKVAKKLYNKEFVFWTDLETREDLGRRLYCFGYVNGQPDHIISFYEETPSKYCLTDFDGSAILQPWFIEPLED